MNPPSEWITKDVSELRIIDDELWNRVQAQYASVQHKWKSAEEGKRFNQFRRPKYLFSGLTKCGECGAGFITYSREQLGCFGARGRGTCTNLLTIPRQEVEQRVLKDGQLRIELRGNLAAMLTAAQKTKRSPETGDLFVPIQLVAGARNKLYRQLCWAAA